MRLLSLTIVCVAIILYYAAIVFTLKREGTIFSQCTKEIDSYKKCSEKHCGVKHSVPLLLKTVAPMESEKARICITNHCLRDISRVHNCAERNNLIQDHERKINQMGDIGACASTYCANGWRCCQTITNGSLCYDTSVNSCINGLLCPKNYLTCGQKCFNPSNLICLNGNLYSKAPEEESTDDLDENSTSYKNVAAVRDQHLPVVIDKGEPLSCTIFCAPPGCCVTRDRVSPEKCYDAINNDCVYGLICPSEYLACGDKCYNPEERLCLNGVIYQTFKAANTTNSN